MAQPERALQRAVCEWLGYVLLPPAWWTSIPAGGGGKVRGAILRSTGYHAGTPDLLFIHNGHAYWIELKAAKGRLSEVQMITRYSLEGASSPVHTCRSIEEVRDSLVRWGFPLRPHRL